MYKSQAFGGLPDFCFPTSDWDTPRSVLFLLPQTEDVLYRCSLTTNGNTKDHTRTYMSSWFEPRRDFMGSLN